MGGRGRGEGGAVTAAVREECCVSLVVGSIVRTFLYITFLIVCLNSLRTYLMHVRVVHCVLQWYLCA